MGGSSTARILLAALILAGAVADGAAGQSQSGEAVLDLSGDWAIRFDTKNTGRDAGWDLPVAWEEPKGSLTVAVPGPWEADPRFAGYDGVAWYHTRFTPPGEREGGAALLRFESVNYACTVYANGVEIGGHEGGYAPFTVPLPDTGEGRPVDLVLRVVDPGRKPVDGWSLDRIPHAKESWYYNYGGITGPVTLRLLPKIHVRDLFPMLTAPEGVDSPGGNAALACIENLSNEAVEVSFRLHLEKESTGEAAMPPVSGTMEVPPGGVEHRIDLPDGGIEPWSPESPVRYGMRIEIESEGGRHARSVMTGARLFELRPDGFRLNGKKIYMKGILYQPYYPKTLVRPPEAGWVQREVDQILACGFNLVRAHLRPPPEAFLDACDRAGLLVMAEPPLGWIYEETEALPSRALDAVEGLLRGARHHPSVVWWGMLNELSGVVYPLAGELMAAARALDPTRLITDDSGGWGGEGRYLPPFASEPAPYLDYHIYLPYPLSANARDYLGKIGGSGDRPAVVSEFGFGGMGDLQKTAAFFKGLNRLEDGAEYAAQLREAKHSRANTPLREAFGSLEAMLREATRIQAEAALEIGSALKENETIHGYCYTQYRDVSWESGAGIVNVDGSPKAAYQALQMLNAYGPPDGEARDAQPGGKRPPGEEVPPGGMSLPAPFIPPVELPPGEGEVYLYKTPDALAALLADRQAVVPLDKTSLVRPGRNVILSGDPLSLDRPENIKPYLRVMRYVREGGILVFLEPPVLDPALAPAFMNYDREGFVPDLPLQVHYRAARGTFVGQFHYVTPKRRFFIGMEAPPRMLGRGFGDVLPHHAHLPLGVEGAEIIAGTYDAYGIFTGGGLLGLPYGKGRIILSNFRLLPLLGQNAVADYLLVCIVEYALAHGGTAQFPDKEREPPDHDPLPVPTNRMAENLSEAMHLHRRYLALGERLSLQRLDGKRNRYHFYPGLFQWNGIRIRGLEQMLDGRFGEALQTLQTIEDAVEPPLKAWLSMEEKLHQRLSTLSPERRNPMVLRRTARCYHLGLQNLWNGKSLQLDRAMEWLAQAFEILPE